MSFGSQGDGLLWGLRRCVQWMEEGATGLMYPRIVYVSGLDYQLKTVEGSCALGSLESNLWKKSFHRFDGG